MLAKKIDNSITKNNVKFFLKTIDSYTVFHKTVRFKFKTSSIEAHANHQHWQGNLLDMTHYKTHNDNYTFILFVIDVYTGYLWLKALKNKKPASVVKELTYIQGCRDPACLYLYRSRD